MSLQVHMEGDECPQCGGLLSPGLPRGLCPQCALRGALALPVEDIPGEGQGADGSGGQQFGDYELLCQIAHGGMGVVWKARQRSLNRIVAVKMILSGRFATPDQIARFRREAEAAGRLRHPNIVAIHETGELDGQHYFSMEYIPGRTLADRIRDHGPAAPREAARWVKLLADAVQHAHERGVLHRDLKPANVLLDAYEEPHIADFGLAKQSDASQGLTVAGQVLGSPNYSPPEQIDGRNGGLSPASDVYSLGAILYHLLTGRPPFAAAEMAETIRQALAEEPIAPRTLDPGVPRDLETVCLKCLQKEPRRRYATARELADELGRFLDGCLITARPAGPVVRVVRWARRNPLGTAFIVVLAAAAGTTGLLLHRMERESEKDRQTIQVIGERLLNNIEDMWGRRDRTSELVRAEELSAIVNRPMPRTGRGASPVRYTVGATVGESPIAQIQRYAPFLGRLEERWGEQLGRPVVLDLRLLKFGSADVAEVIRGDVDLRRMGALSYVTLRQHSAEVRALARENRPKDCAIFVRRGSGIARLQDLAGRSIAFGKAHSTISCLAKVELVRAGVHGHQLAAWRHLDNRQAYLERLHRVGLRAAIASNTHGHAEVIAAVRRGEFDAGVARREFVQDFAGADLMIIHEFASLPNVWVAVGQRGAELARPLQVALIGAESVAGGESGDDPVLLRLVAADEAGFAPLRRALADEVPRFEGNQPLRMDEIGEDE